MTNAEIAKRLVKVRPIDTSVVSRAKYGIYAPGIPGLCLLAETFVTRESAVKRQARVVEHVTAILNAADVVRNARSDGESGYLAGAIRRSQRERRKKFYSKGT